MSTTRPEQDTRWRCERCGNLTRFDVVRTVRSREYVHVTLGGEPTVEESVVLAERIEQVICRWCQGVDTVTLEPRPSAASSTDPSSTDPSSTDPSSTDPVSRSL